MKKVSILAVLSSLLLVSCFDSSKPNYQYFPNMYESVGYKTYAESEAFRNGIEAQLPLRDLLHVDGHLMIIPIRTMDMKLQKLI